MRSWRARISGCWCAQPSRFYMLRYPRADLALHSQCRSVQDLTELLAEQLFVRHSSPSVEAADVVDSRESEGAELCGSRNRGPSTGCSSPALCSHQTAHAYRDPGSPCGGVAPSSSRAQPAVQEQQRHSTEVSAPARSPSPARATYAQVLCTPYTTPEDEQQIG